MTEQGKLRMEIALRDVEELFPFRFISIKMPTTTENSLQYRPSYLRAMEHLDNLLDYSTSR